MKSFKPLTKELPFGDRIVIEMRDVVSFISQLRKDAAIVGSEKNILAQFAEAFARGTVVDQSMALENFTEWPNQGVVVGIGPKVDQQEMGISVGDTVFLRGPNGISMKIERRILRVISPMDIYIVRHDT